uniref:long-chain-fatty-acid--CoA ligase n=1 Tax=Anisakis simplex TaxID=6269 RepID=A0A0M3J374_ANISI
LFAFGLIAIGIAPGQETFVAIYSKNRPEWTISELGVYTIRSVVVSLYDTLGTAARSFIINQASVEVVICDAEEKASALVKCKSECPTLKYIIMMDACSKQFKDTAKQAGVAVYGFDEIEQLGAKLDPKPSLEMVWNVFEQLNKISRNKQVISIQRPKMDDLCTLCYTSGTTGTPKGVMLTHGNVIATTTVFQYLKNVKLTNEDVLISYLPLAHMYERIVENAAFQCGARVGFSRGDIKLLSEDIVELKPTMMPLVPRILTRIFDKVTSTSN